MQVPDLCLLFSGFISFVGDATLLVEEKLEEISQVHVSAVVEGCPVAIKLPPDDTRLAARGIIQLKECV